MFSELTVWLFGCLVAMAQAAMLSRTVAATGSLIRSGPEAATGLRGASQPLALRQLSSLFTSSSSCSINKRSAGALKTFALFNSKAKAKAPEPKKVSLAFCGVGKMGMVKSNYGVVMGRVWIWMWIWLGYGYVTLGNICSRKIVSHIAVGEKTRENTCVKRKLMMRRCRDDLCAPTR